MCLSLPILSASVSWSRPSHVGESPYSTVQSLYNIVIVRTPIGISTYGNRFLTFFAPYLSKRLINQIKTTRLCEKDWRVRHLDHLVKLPFAWLEFGLFSGDDDLAEVSAFHIDRQELQNDGSTYVYVRLKSRQEIYSADLPKSPPEKPFYWDVAVRVVKEGGNSVVDDIIYLKGQVVDSESRLSEVLMMGCQGPRWVGYPRNRGHTPIPGG